MGLSREARQGWLAAQTLGIFIKCPYRRGTLENANWWFGWEEATGKVIKPFRPPPSKGKPGAPEIPDDDSFPTSD
jgi:hypothetical protein